MTKEIANLQKAIADEEAKAAPSKATLFTLNKQLISFLAEQKK